MRLVQVTVPEEKREAVLEVLDDEGIDYVMTDASDDPDYSAAVFFPLPTEAVEPVLTTLAERDVDERGHSVILSAETVVSKEFEELQREYETADEPDERVAFEELRNHRSQHLQVDATTARISVV